MDLPPGGLSLNLTGVSRDVNCDDSRCMWPSPADSFPNSEVFLQPEAKGHRN